MASYIEKILGPDERIVAVGRLTGWIYAGWIALSVVTLGLALPFLLIPWIRQKSTNLVVTNRRVIAKYGLVSRRTIEMRLSKIESTRIEQGFWARIGGFGTVLIDGTGGTMEPIAQVADPLGFKRAIETALEAYEDSAGTGPRGG